MDNIQSKETEHGSYQYDYDDLYRLTTVDNPVQDDEAFTYDEVGNRLTAADTSDNWSYNQNNELSGYDDTSYVYDDNGNMVQKIVAGVVTNYVYNTEDRLIEVRDGSGSLISSYYYDPFGRRLWKEVSGVRTYFHYADEGLIGEYDASGLEIKTYGYKPGSTWTTDPLFMKVGTDYYFYHNDHLGTPQKMTGVNGAFVWSAKYSSFGKAEIDPSSTITNNLRFGGQFADEETGLHYNWNRYYDPDGGRYSREDPIGLKGGVNVFAYVDNNPIVRIDPRGLYETTVQSYCRRYPNSCRELFPPPPIPPSLPREDGTTETIEVPSGPEDEYDGTGTPESCLLTYQANLRLCECLQSGSVRWCKFKAWIGYVGCMINNLGS